MIGKANVLLQRGKIETLEEAMRAWERNHGQILAREALLQSNRTRVPNTLVAGDDVEVQTVGAALRDMM